MRRSEEERGAKKKRGGGRLGESRRGGGMVRAWLESAHRQYRPDVNGSAVVGRGSTGSTVEAGCVSEGRRREEEVEFGAALRGLVGQRAPSAHCCTHPPLSTECWCVLTLRAAPPHHRSRDSCDHVSVSVPPVCQTIHPPTPAPHCSVSRGGLAIVVERALQGDGHFPPPNGSALPRLYQSDGHSRAIRATDDTDKLCYQ